MTTDTIIRLSNMVRYDEHIKEYIAAQLRNIGASQMTPPTDTSAGTGGTVPVPPAGLNNRYLRCDGVWEVPPNTTYSDIEGATENSVGKGGLVPAPVRGGQNLFLKGDGTWDSPVGTQYSVATIETAGLCPKLAGGNTKFLRADGRWATPTGIDAIVSTENAGLCPKLAGGGTKFLRADGNWAVPIGTTYGYASNKTVGIVKIGDNLTIDNGLLSLTKENIYEALGYTASAEYDVVSVHSDGLCPKLLPSTSAYLRGDGIWAIPPNTTYDVVTDFSSGLMSPEMYKKLDGIEKGANKTIVLTGTFTGNGSTLIVTFNANTTPKLVLYYDTDTGVTYTPSSVNNVRFVTFNTTSNTLYKYIVLI